MKTTTCASVVTLLLLVTACAGRSDPGGDESYEQASPSDAESAGIDRQDTDERSDDAATESVQEYQLLAAQLEESVIDYRVTMMSDHMNTLEDCRNALDQYDHQARPWLSEMIQTGNHMDEFLVERGGDASADLLCVAANMMAELDHHHALACTKGDLDADQAEVTRHVDAMLGYVEHTWDRCEQLMDGFDTGSWKFGPMMGGCEDFDELCFDDTTRGGMMHGPMMGGPMMGGTMTGDACGY